MPRNGGVSTAAVNIGGCACNAKPRRRFRAGRSEKDEPTYDTNARDEHGIAILKCRGSNPAAPASQSGIHRLIM
jgi:hypothetical protein